MPAISTAQSASRIGALLRSDGPPKEEDIRFPPSPPDQAACLQLSAIPRIAQAAVRVIIPPNMV